MTHTVIIKSISELHELFSYPDKPDHPLISLIDFSKIQMRKDATRYILGFYLVSLKKLKGADYLYGRKDHDFSEASLICMAPEQLSFVSNIEEESSVEGWGLYFHPDLIRSSFLNDKIKSYGFFSYDMNEALHLSDKEKKTLYAVVETIKQEYSMNLDSFSNDLIVSNIEVLLNYCKRFYGRQFLTRAHHNKGIVSQFEKLLSDYFESEEVKTNGLPSVKYCAKKLHLSPNYLGDLLKQETGKSAMEHIHYHLIEKAKSLLLNSSQSVSEIAYQLGYEQTQNFSKFFKKKTQMSPLEYRRLN
ncbi:helix-turn-helix domain-containing protein [Marinifilum caeruleilacunae]|uniref:AraC family transcriptional regulator n=1 Tax=Marinifilum caeruleilacunae TaxID=2499076 RepID=A0ABX1WQW4_9BACT|nr:helix-turn-helix domain-containing protein [Marinifilum caeruleilacunae]NOU58370.1 AraC family transcriptional regulator [Marinifilum caeruleilacunae]